MLYLSLTNCDIMNRIVRCLFYSSIICLTIFWGCNDSTPSLLEDFDLLVQDEPDSAYLLLRSFDRSLLHSDEDKAHFSLLYSIALDKEYIDVSEDSLINVAVNHYGKELSRNAFLSWYYQGRVYENAKRYEDAMKSYIKAESIPESLVDPLYLAKLHFGKGRVYNYSFDKPSALEEAKASAKYSLAAGHMNNYARAVLDQAGFYCVTGDLEHSDYAKADSCLNIVKSLWPQISDQRKNNWYSTRISSLVCRNDVHEMELMIAEYLDFMSSSPEKVEWMTLATAYKSMGDIHSMKDALDRGVRYGLDSGKEAAAYQLLLAEANAGLGQFEDAYKNEVRYIKIIEDRGYDVFRHDTKFIEERYLNQLSQSKAKNRLLGMALFVLLFAVISSALSYLLFKHKKETSETKLKLMELQEEYDALNSLSIPDSEIDMKALPVLERRMRTLKSFLAKDEKAALELDRLLGDRTAVLESIGMIYAIYAPKFTEALIAKGLRPSEVGYCCLFLMGYSTKEAGEFICYSGYYNVSSKIRAKLQIDPNASTLAKWLKQLFHDTQA